MSLCVSWEGLWGRMAECGMNGGTSVLAGPYLPDHESGIRCAVASYPLRGLIDCREVLPSWRRREANDVMQANSRNREGPGLCEPGVRCGDTTARRHDWSLYFGFAP